MSERKELHLIHNTPEWLTFRKSGIGASEAAAVLGLSKWKSNVELWEEKVGLREPQNIIDNPFVQYGNAAEEPLIRLFAAQYINRYRVTVDKTKVYVKDVFQFASLDGELVDLETNELGIYEGKTVEANKSLVWEEWRDQIPQHYYIQLLHQLLVTGRNFNVINAELRWTDPNGEIATRCKRMVIRTTDKNVLPDMKLLDDAEHEFWGYVKRGERPPRLLPEL